MECTTDRSMRRCAVDVLLRRGAGQGFLTGVAANFVTTGGKGDDSVTEVQVIVFS